MVEGDRWGVVLSGGGLGLLLAVIPIALCDYSGHGVFMADKRLELLLLGMLVGARGGAVRVGWQTRRRRGVGALQTLSAFDGGCLACTVGPEDGGHLPMASSPRHTLKGSGCAKSLGKIAHSHSHSHSHSHGLGHGGVRTSCCMTGVTSVGDESKATLTR